MQHSAGMPVLLLSRTRWQVGQMMLSYLPLRNAGSVCDRRGWLKAMHLKESEAPMKKVLEEQEGEVPKSTVSKMTGPPMMAMKAGQLLNAIASETTAEGTAHRL